MENRQTHPFKFFSKLRWIDGRPLMDLIEPDPYRLAIFEAAYQHDEGLDKDIPGSASRVKYNLILRGAAKKNWKTADLVLWCLYKLTMWLSWSGNQVYTLCNDKDQAADDHELGKRLISANPGLEDLLIIKQNVVERKDGKGFWEILPAGDAVGSHGKTYLLCAFDEIHGYRNWDILEAMQLDPSRPDSQMWLTSYASLYHKPGVPLFDLFNAGKRGDDPRMLFSWYAADFTTDPNFENALPEDRANPSRGSWADKNYLEQQKRRLPAHKYRRLHLNLPGLPEGSAYSVEKIMDATERGVAMRPSQPDVEYSAFVDMSGGSNDDATLGISHKEGDGDEARYVLDLIMDQGPRPPFDPRKAVERFAKVLKQYRCYSLTGDKYAGETFINDFQNHGIGYTVSTLSKSEIYQALEAPLNSSRVILLDEPKLESQLLGLVWRANKIDHALGEHDDWANAAAGTIHAVLEGNSISEKDFWAGGERQAYLDDEAVWITGPRGGRYW